MKRLGPVTTRNASRVNYGKKDMLGKYIAAGFFVMATPWLVGCVNDQARPFTTSDYTERPDVNFLPANPDDRFCRSGMAQSLIGQARISDRVAKEMTGSRFVRQVGPDDPISRDFNLDRVTITNDPRTGRIVDAGCF